jgi:hypothetical protein
MKIKLKPIFIALALCTSMGFISCDNQQSVQEEELENQDINVNYKVFADDLKRDLKDDVQRLDNLVHSTNNVNENPEVIKDFTGNVEDQREESTAQLNKLQDKKISENDLKNILLSKKGEFQDIIKSEIERFDEQLKNYENELNTLNNNSRATPEIKEKFKKQIALIKNSRDQMAKRYMILDNMGVEGYEKAKEYVVAIKKGFEQEALQRLDILNTQFTVLPKEQNDIKDFNLKTDQTNKLIIESKSVSAVNWQDLREKIEDSISSLENKVAKLSS